MPQDISIMLSFGVLEVVVGTDNVRGDLYVGARDRVADLDDADAGIGTEC